MNPVSFVRFLSLAALSGTLGASMFAGAAFAQSLPGAPSTGTQPIQIGSNTDALNWAGYVATNGTYTSVSGSWVVPTVADGGAENVADATWVGIGGVVSADLIQAGTEAVPDSQGGLAYQAWYELLPQDAVVMPLTISPGDAVAVSITEESEGVWEISFDDATTEKMYDTTVQYDSSLSSADWVEEMPVEVGGVIGLDDFGTVDFTSGYAIKDGQAATIQSAGAVPLTMNNAQGTPVATTSALGAGGSSFSVSRTDAASTPLTLAGDGVAAVEVGSSYSYASGGYGAGSYTVHVHRGRSGYRIFVQF